MLSVKERKKSPTLGGNVSKDGGQNNPTIVNPLNTNNQDALMDAFNNWKDNHPTNGGSNGYGNSNGGNGGWGSNGGSNGNWNPGNGNSNPHIDTSVGSYENAYSGAINSLIDQAVNRQPFEYNPATDAAYQAYARMYGRLGNQAAQDTLADVAAQTGGLASSYATTAASQARANYNQALTDKIPELMQLAYDKYHQQYQDTMSNIDMLTGLSNSLYGRYTDKRDFEWNVKQYEQQLAQSQNAQQYEQMLNMWATLGYANSTIAAFFGIPVGTKTDDASYRAAQLALANSK